TSAGTCHIENCRARKSIQANPYVTKCNITASHLLSSIREKSFCMEGETDEQSSLSIHNRQDRRGVRTRLCSVASAVENARRCKDPYKFRKQETISRREYILACCGANESGI